MHLLVDILRTKYIWTSYQVLNLKNNKDWVQTEDVTLWAKKNSDILVLPIYLCLKVYGYTQCQYDHMLFLKYSELGKFTVFIIDVSLQKIMKKK